MTCSAWRASRIRTFAFFLLWMLACSRTVGAFVVGYHRRHFSFPRHFFFSSSSSSSSSLGSTKKTTQYTIDETVCPPTRPHVLEAAVTKACASLDIFLSRKPIAAHTQKAFDAVEELVERDNQKPIILDSGCGTGRSTVLLGEHYPNHIVIGVDRSFVRLSKNQSPQADPTDTAAAARPKGDETEDSGDDDGDDESSKRPFCEQLASNTFLVRAELVDFWILCLQKEQWKIDHHFLLYPNPYPKLNRLTQRWYAHPSFPLILQLGSETITIRSNWKGFLEEFAQSVEIAHDFYESIQDKQPQEQEGGGSGRVQKYQNYAYPYLESAQLGPQPRTNKTIAWTNFELKYDNVGESTYELKLERLP